MPYSVAAKNKMLDALGVATLSLHSADPGATGANELTGGSPAYARKAVAAPAAASNGSKQVSGSVTFDVPAGSTVAFVGQWSNDATPVWLGYDATDSVESYVAQGTYQVTTTTDDLNATASA